MERPVSKHALLIHHLRVDADEVFVAATSAERWQWELEDGRLSAVNATDLVAVTLQRGQAGAAVTETVWLFPNRHTPERALALGAIPQLLDAAWSILDNGWDEQQARDRLYGQRLESLLHSGV
jgi:hypothetical protein